MSSIITMPADVLSYNTFVNACGHVVNNNTPFSLRLGSGTVWLDTSISMVRVFVTHHFMYSMTLENYLLFGKYTPLPDSSILIPIGDANHAMAYRIQWLRTAHCLGYYLSPFMLRYLDGEPTIAYLPINPDMPTLEQLCMAVDNVVFPSVKELTIT